MLEKNFKDKLLSFVNKPPEKLAVAVSGGADSMCLAFLSKKLLKDTDIIALIVDHGLRSESAKEAKLVQKRLSRLAITSHILKWSGKKPTSNIQENAREARYDLLTKFCKKNKINCLLTAHNFDDQAETVLMRVYRGSGIDGISGMKAHSSYNSVEILRPLIGIKRTDIESYLKTNKIKWVDDPSNLNERFDRVKIRKLLRSLDDTDVWLERLNLLASNSARSADFINSEVEKTFKKFVHIDKLGFMSLRFTDFNSLHQEIALKILVKILGMFSGNIQQPRLQNLLKLENSIRNNEDCCLSGVEIKHIKDNIYFIREFKAIKSKVINGIWDNRFKVSNQPVKALGADGWKQIKSLVEVKDCPHIKVIYSLPAVIKNDRIIFVPFILKSHTPFTIIPTWVSAS
jgi:tRNA(Ile)-lysidine synthase